MEQSPSKPSFSQITKKSLPKKFAQPTYPPKREHAILMDHVPEARNDDYLNALKEIVNPKLIRFLCRISNNRVSCYLDSKQTVDDLVTKEKSIFVLNTVVPIRPLISGNKRIILSNVAPEIPHSSIETELKNHGIQLQSSITYMRINTSLEDCKDICGNRRQVLVTPEDFKKLPGVLKIHFDDLIYHIYPTSDTIFCFHCKLNGHVSKDCPELAKIPHATSTEDTEDPTFVLQNSEEISPTENNILSDPLLDSANLLTSPIGNARSLPYDPNMEKSDFFPFLTPTNTAAVKRALTSTSSEASYNNNNTENDLSESHDPPSDSESLASNSSQKAKKSKKTKPRTKKAKKDDAKNLDDKLDWSELEKLIQQKEEEGKKFPLDLKQLMNLLECSKGNYNKEMVTDHSSDLSQLSEMLLEIHPCLPSLSLKNRCTRLKNKITSWVNAPDVPQVEEVDGLVDADHETPLMEESQGS